MKCLVRSHKVSAPNKLSVGATPVALHWQGRSKMIKKFAVYRVRLRLGCLRPIRS